MTFFQTSKKYIEYSVSIIKKLREFDIIMKKFAYLCILLLIILKK